MSGRHILYMVLVLGALGIQWPLWYNTGGILHVRALERELASIQASNERQRSSNNRVAAEIESLESGSGAIEERARMRLGMIRNDEILFRLVAKGEKAKAEQALVLQPSKGNGSVFRPKNHKLYVMGVTAAAQRNAERRKAAQRAGKR